MQYPHKYAIRLICDLCFPDNAEAGSLLVLFFHRGFFVLYNYNDYKCDTKDSGRPDTALIGDDVSRF